MTDLATDLVHAVRGKVRFDSGSRALYATDALNYRQVPIGGMLGNESCGVHSVMSQFYGPGPKTADNTHRLEIATYDGERMWVGPTTDDERQQIIGGGGRRGEIYAALAQLRDTYADAVRKKFPKIPRRVSGY